MHKMQRLKYKYRHSKSPIRGAAFPPKRVNFDTQNLDGKISGLDHVPPGEPQRSLLAQNMKAKML